ncbi:MAG: restriction endonuclease subunit S, partial [Planctomycetota bacterium]|nr:restriction endonuclease subunit S [Planctomycetota bacterium]
SLKIPLPPINTQRKLARMLEYAYEKKKAKEAQAQELLTGIDAYLSDQLDVILPKADNHDVHFSVMFSSVTGNRWDCAYHKHYFKLLEDALTAGKFKTQNLGSLITFIESGSRPKGGVANLTEGVFSIGGEHVTRGLEIDTDTNPKYVSKEFHELNRRTETHINDILLVKDGATTGKVAYIREQKHANQNVNEHVFILRVGKEIDTMFFANYLASELGQIFIRRAITGATVTGLTKQAVKSLKVPVPPIDMQASIAKRTKIIRDNAKLLIAEAQAELERAKKEVEEMILGGTLQ